MTVQELRRMLLSRMTQLSYLMEKMIVERSLQKMKSIETLSTRLAVISHCSLHVHYRWILKMRNEVIDILPPAEGKFKSQRKKILDLLQQAEQTINADYKRRVKVSGIG